MCLRLSLTLGLLRQRTCRHRDLYVFNRSGALLLALACFALCTRGVVSVSVSATARRVTSHSHSHSRSDHAVTGRHEEEERASHTLEVLRPSGEERASHTLEVLRPSAASASPAVTAPSPSPPGTAESTGHGAASRDVDGGADRGHAEDADSLPPHASSPAAVADGDGDGHADSESEGEGEGEGERGLRAADDGAGVPGVSGLEDRRSSPSSSSSSPAPSSSSPSSPPQSPSPSPSQSQFESEVRAASQSLLLGPRRLNAPRSDGASEFQVLTPVLMNLNLDGAAAKLETDTARKLAADRRLSRALSSGDRFAPETGDALLDNFGSPTAHSEKDTTQLLLHPRKAGQRVPGRVPGRVRVRVRSPESSGGSGALRDPEDDADDSAAAAVPYVYGGPSVPSLMVKSRSDDRRYRRLRLRNGLDALLVQDVVITKSAAAMDVGVGYWYDPPDISGLAHFLEHMLFLGTRQFPREDEFSSYLSAHGGSSNAYTSHLNTNFFFDVDPSALHGALLRFAGFFIDPLMSESATEREVRAVESEHLKNVQSDDWRAFQLLSSFARPQHPYHKFGTGSTQTLGAVPKPRLRRELFRFWREHYVARNLRLAVLGRHSLDAMERWVRAIFDRLPTGTADSAGHAAGPPPFLPSSYVTTDRHAEVFTPGLFPSVVHFQSVQDKRSLLLVWPIPPQTREYRSKNVDFVANLLGHEGPGSLTASLRRRGWVASLFAGSDVTTNQFDLFQLRLELTHSGFQPRALSAIVGLVLQHIRLIALRGVEEWRWREMGRISAVAFRMKNKEDSISYVSALAEAMPKYEPRDLLMAGYVYQNYDPKVRLRSAFSIWHTPLAFWPRRRKACA